MAQTFTRTKTFFALTILALLTASHPVHCAAQSPQSPPDASPSQHNESQPQQDNWSAVDKESGVTETTTPIQELVSQDVHQIFQSRLKAGDYRFLGTHSHSNGFPYIPGIKGGLPNDLVLSKGIIMLHGTRHFAIDTADADLQTRALSFAASYNQMMVGYLIQSKDKQACALHDSGLEEIEKLEKRDPIADAKTSFDSGQPHVFTAWLPSGGHDLPGLSQKIKEDLHIESWDLTITPELCATPEETERYNRLLTAYIIPYNQSVYALATQPQPTHRSHRFLGIF